MMFVDLPKANIASVVNGGIELWSLDSRPTLFTVKPPSQLGSTNYTAMTRTQYFLIDFFTKVFNIFIFCSRP